MCITESPENYFFTGILQPESISKNSNFHLNAASRRLEKAYLTKKGVTKIFPEQEFSQEHPWRTRFLAAITQHKFTVQADMLEAKKHKMRQPKARGTGTDNKITSKEFTQLKLV